VRPVFLGLLLLVVAVAVLIAVGGYYAEEVPTRIELGRRKVEESFSPQAMQLKAELKVYDPLTAEQVAELKDTLAVVETDYGRFAFELYPEDAPQTVQNFVWLVENGFYDGQLLAGGAPMEQIAIDGVSSDEKFYYRIPGELNDRYEDTGAVVLERAVDPAYADGLPEDDRFLDSGATRVWIVIKPKPQGMPKFAVFGHIVAGMDVVQSVSMAMVKGLPEFAPEVLIYRIRLVKRDELGAVMQEPVEEPTDPPWWAPQRTRLPMK